MKRICLLPALLLALATVVVPATTTRAESPYTLHLQAQGDQPSGGALSRATYSRPATNVASAGPLLDAHHIVYGVALPRMHAPTCVSCGDAPFAGFHVQVFIRRYTSGARGLVVSPPRLLFTGPRGAQLAFLSFHRDWLVYLTNLYVDTWTLIVRNVVSGRQIVLDSKQREGTTGPFSHADSDGRTVVWRSWNQVHGRETSVIRSYSLVTGQRHLLLAGGPGQGFLYDDPEVWGNRLAFARDYRDGGIQLFLKNLTTGRIQALTPRQQSNFSIVISGTIAVWIHGGSGIGRRHGLVALNLGTGRRVALHHSSTAYPVLVAERYVVFTTDFGRPSLQVYDTRTRQRGIIAGPIPADGAGSPGEEIETGGHVVLYSPLSPCGSPTFTCPGHDVLVELP